MAEEIISVIDAGNTEWVLNNNVDRFVLPGPQNRFMPSFGFSEDTVPFQDGTRFKSVRGLPREVPVPVLIKEPTPEDLRIHLRELASALNPKLGNIKLRVTAPDGPVRELNCRYAGGMQLSEAEGEHGLTWQKSLLVFRAFDPY